MKKLFYFLLCLFLFTACDNIVLRKDKSERITFNETLPNGEYSIYMYEIKYPEKQKDKIAFMTKFENFLENGVEGYKRDINFILSKDLYEDVESVLADEGIGNERIFFKSASFINEEDKKLIDRETKSVKTPMDGGEIQKYLNKQYYHILSLVGRENEYRENFFYTEYDKRKITSEYINRRENLKKILSEKKKDFLVLAESRDELKNYEDDMVYLNEYDSRLEKSILEGKEILKSPVTVIKSDKYKGYVLNGNNLVFFDGSGKEELNYFRRYNFNVKVKKIDNFNISNFITDDEQVEISVLLGRKKYVPKRPLEEKF
ncbi:MAG: hypothetical protein ACLVH8_03325 [Fusobacterium sp.]